MFSPRVPLNKGCSDVVTSDYYTADETVECESPEAGVKYSKSKGFFGWVVFPPLSSVSREEPFLGIPIFPQRVFNQNILAESGQT